MKTKYVTKNREASKRTWERQKSMGYKNYTLREKPEFIEKVKEFVKCLKERSST